MMPAHEISRIGARAKEASRLMAKASPVTCWPPTPAIWKRPTPAAWTHPAATVCA